MQTLTTSVSLKLGEIPIPEVFVGDKPPEVKISPVTTFSTTTKETKGNYFPSMVKILKLGFNMLRGILHLKISRILIA